MRLQIIRWFLVVFTSATTATLTDCKQSYYGYYYDNYFESCITVGADATTPPNDKNMSEYVTET